MTETVPSTGKKIDVKLSFELHDWSETLTFNQISDTLFIVGQFLNNEEHTMFAEKDLSEIQSWLAKNDVNNFLRAKTVALSVLQAEQENRMFAQEISKLPYRRPSSH